MAGKKKKVGKTKKKKTVQKTPSKYVNNLFLPS